MSLFESAIAGSQQALQELTKLVEEVAETIGRSKIIKLNSRFVFPGVKNKEGQSILSTIISELSLREVFTTALKEAAGIKHNICVKLQGDEKRRPFEDVAMTFVKDMLENIPFSDW